MFLPRIARIGSKTCVAGKTILLTPLPYVLIRDNAWQKDIMVRNACPKSRTSFGQSVNSFPHRFTLACLRTYLHEHFAEKRFMPTKLLSPANDYKKDIFIS